MKKLKPKFLNNLPKGYHFDTDDLQQIASYKRKWKTRLRRLKKVRIID